VSVSRIASALFVAVPVLLAAERAGAQGFKLFGDGMDRPDLRYDYFGGQAIAGDPNAAVELKGLDSRTGYLPGANSIFGPASNRVRLRVGERPGNWSACRTIPDCIGSVYVYSQRVPAHAYGQADANGVNLLPGGPYHSSRGYVAVSLWSPDDVKRKASASKSSVKIKQKSYVAVALGGIDSTGITAVIFPASTWVVPGCKGQASAQSNYKKGTNTARLKVSCKAASVEAALGGGNYQELLDRLAFMGLGSKLKFDWKGEQPLP
jgi:hypothetical protein